MNVVTWARVSTKDQADGYSLDAQLRAMQEKAVRQGWKIIREFTASETGRRSSDRVEFKKMLAWVKDNFKRESIGGIVFHKLDRACRNIRDAVVLKELEEETSVRLFFVDNQFGEGAAGQLSFNVLVSVAQFYSDNLRAESLKGMNEKAEQGWLPGRPPYGYNNDTSDSSEPIKVHPLTSKAIQRAFELYAMGGQTFDTVSARLAAEGFVYKETEPNFGRRNLSFILNNRFYMGELLWHGRTILGKHKPIIDRSTFEICQDILQGRNKRTGFSLLPLAGGLFQCRYCGHGLTGERIRKKLRSGGYKEHIYYRCANNHRSPDHPKVRWRKADLESAIVKELGRLKLPDEEVTAWFRKSLGAALKDEGEFYRQKLASLRRRESELVAGRDRLLNALIGGSVDEGTFKEKGEQVRLELERVRDELSRDAKKNQNHSDMALAIFDFTQGAAKTWLGSNDAIRRELLEVVSLNREIESASLCFDWRSPFAELLKQEVVGFGIPSRI